MPEIVKLENMMGQVKYANGGRIELSTGITLTVGQEVILPDIAGGKQGKVDSIGMEFNEETMEAEVVLRIVENDSGTGHQFRWEA